MIFHGVCSLYPLNYCVVINVFKILNLVVISFSSLISVIIEKKTLGKRESFTINMRMITKYNRIENKS